MTVLVVLTPARLSSSGMVYIDLVPPTDPADGTETDEGIFRSDFLDFLDAIDFFELLLLPEPTLFPSALEVMR